VVMCVIYLLCSSAGTLTTIAYDCLVRTDYGDECDFATDYTYVIYIFGNLFLLARNVYGQHVAWHHTFILHPKANLENQKKLKNRLRFEVIS
jgi:hypothetical protein